MVLTNTIQHLKSITHPDRIQENDTQDVASINFGLSDDKILSD